MANEQQQFEGLVSKLLSPDNDIRNDAEARYGTIPDVTKIQFLLNTILTSSNLEIRVMASVLLRRLLSNIEEFTTSIPEEVQQLCKVQLLQGVQALQDSNLRKKYCDVIAELAKCYISDSGDNLWPDILKFLFESCNSPSEETREIPLHILCSFPGIFGTQQDTYMQVIKEMLMHCLQPTNSLKIRYLAARATCTFIVESVEETKHKLFADLVPFILQALEASVKNEDDDAVLKGFVELADTGPKAIKPHLIDSINLMLMIVSNVQLENSWRQLALEAIVTLSESAPAIVRKFGAQLIPKIVPEMLALMVDLDDEPDWSNQDDPEDTETDSNPVAGESGLDRFACGIGGKVVYPQIHQTIPLMLKNEDWRYRHAGLMAISAAAEGCKKQMEPILNNIVSEVLTALVDPHPRVRYAACNALGQLATDFTILFQKSFHATVVPGLLQVLISDGPHPRVQAHASAALVNFCEDCPISILEPYLDALVEKLEQVLTSKMQQLSQKGSRLVLEQVLTSMATVADTAEAKFVKYYDRVMPSLKYIFENAVSKEYRLMRGKCIECISLIGLAVGNEKFLPDASAVMQLLLKTQSGIEELEVDDPIISYLISAWARMCKIIGKDFVQYLPVVMPNVLKAAQIKPEVALLDADDPSNEDQEKEGWEFVNLGEQQRFGIKTSGLEDKSTACKMLVHYARELKDGFVDYAEQVVRIMVPLLTFYFHDDILFRLLVLVEKSRESDVYLQQMWGFISPVLLKAVSEEPEEEVIPEMMDSFAKCVELLGVGYISTEHLTQLGQIIHEKFEKHMERHEERHEKRKDEDYDEEVEEDLMEQHNTDEYILSKVSDIMHALFKTHREAIIPFFQQLLPDFCKLLHPSRPASDRQWSLCIFDDLIEYTGPASINFKDSFAHLMLNYIVDKNPEVRQAAAYGIGMMAVYGGNEYKALFPQAIPLLVQAISQPDSRSKENANPTENGISAVTKICKHHPDVLNVNDIIPTWLTWLPITKDYEEAPHVYGYLCDLVEQNNPAVLGVSHSNIPRIIAIIAEAFAEEVFEEAAEVKERLVRLVRHVQANAEMWNACLQPLQDRQKTVLAELTTNGGA
eukprot:gene10931-12092_t